MLHIIHKACSQDGWATSDDIAAEIGLGDNGRSRAGRVAPRLSVMARLGLIDKLGPGEMSSGNKHVMWSVSTAGEQLMHGHLNKPVTTAIDGMEPGAQLLMMRRLMQRGYISGDEPVAEALRREFEHNRAQRLR